MRWSAVASEKRTTFTIVCPITCFVAMSRGSNKIHDQHVEQLANKGFWHQVSGFEYVRPKNVEDNPKAKLMPLVAPPRPYLFDKAFKSVSGKPEFGISRRGKYWVFHVRFDGVSHYHCLSKLHHITFYNDTSVEFSRNANEHFYVHFFKSSKFAYRGLYRTLQFLILHNYVRNVKMTPWIPMLL